MKVPVLWIAFRSVMRHRGRAAFSLLSISAGVAALIISGGFIEWNLWALREGTIQSRLGHIQVVRPGYLTAGAADTSRFLLPQAPDVLDAISALPHVNVAAPRLVFSGLISHNDTTVSFLGEGVDADKERAIASYLSFGEGRGLSHDDEKGVVLGKGLATSLGVKRGDTVVLLVTNARSGISAVEAVVRDTFFTSSKAFDDVALRAPIALARKLLGVQGAHKWVVLLDATDNTDAAVKETRSFLEQRGGKYEVVPWYAQADYYRKVKELYSAQVDVLYIIIAVIITISISSALMMSVMERTVEIGTLLAIGGKRRTILLMFLAESALLGLVGVLLGLVLGFALASLISAIGIPMPPSPGMDFSYTGKILIRPQIALAAFLTAQVAAIMGGVYPSFRASRLNIIDALRHSQ
jgi:putative ABC transport system permease protein